MRWDNLFTELETQWDAEYSAAERDRTRDLARQAVAETTLAQRVFAAWPGKGAIRVHCGGIGIDFRADSRGKDWLSGTVQSPTMLAGYVLVQLACVSEFEVTSTGVHEAAGCLAGSCDQSSVENRPSLRERIPFRIVVRDLCRRRKRVTVLHSGVLHTGTIDRVGADYLELACHDIREARRHVAVTSVRLLSLDQVALVRIED